MRESGLDARGVGRWWGWRRRLGLDRGDARGGVVVAGGEGGLHVAAEDAAVGARAGDLGKIDTSVAGDAAGDGRDAHAARAEHLVDGVGMGGSGGDGAGGGLLGGRVPFDLGHGLVGLAEEGDDLADRDDVTLGGDDLTEDAGLEGLELNGGLVGLDLGDDVAALDGVAGGLEPAHEGAFGHVSAHLRHHHFESHVRAS